MQDGDYVHQDWPSWRYGPNGQSAVYNHPEEVPDGWEDHPTKVKNGSAPFMNPGYDETIEAQSGHAALQHVPGASGTPNSGNPQGEPEINTQGGETKQTSQPINSLPAIENITKAAIAEQLSTRKVPHNPQWNKEKLYQLLKDHIAPAA